MTNLLECSLQSFSKGYYTFGKVRYHMKEVRVLEIKQSVFADNDKQAEGVKLLRLQISRAEWVMESGRL